MSRFLFATLLCAGLLTPATVNADIVQDWNVTLNDAARTVVTKHNPGVPTRTMAMMNGSIYDAFQAIDRTHAPFKVNTLAPGASADAAASQAAYRVLSDIYPEYQATLDSTLSTRLGAVPNGAAKTAGINLGNSIAQTVHYCPPERWMGSAGRVHTDRWTWPLGHGPNGRPRLDTKRVGSRLGLGTSLGHANSRFFRFDDSFSHNGHEYAALYGCVQ